MNITNLFPETTGSRVTDQAYSADELKAVRNRILRSLSSSQVKIFLYLECTADVRGDLITTITELHEVLRTDIHTVRRDLASLSRKQLILQKVHYEKISTPPFRRPAIAIRVLPLMAARAAAAGEPKAGPAAKAKKLTQEFLESFGLYPATREFRELTERLMDEELKEGFVEDEIRYNWQKHSPKLVRSYVYVHNTLTQHAMEYRIRKKDLSKRRKKTVRNKAEAPRPVVPPLEDKLHVSDEERALLADLLARYQGPSRIILHDSCLRLTDHGRAELHVYENPIILSQAEAAKGSILECLKSLRPDVGHLVVVPHSLEK